MDCGVMKTALEALTCKSAALRDEKGSGSRKTPLLNRIYQTRSSLMHKLVSNGLKAVELENKTESVQQLLILGVGLDTSYNSYCDRTFAVDFAEVIQQQSVASHSDGRCINLVVGDLRQADVMFDDLLKVGFDPNIPTLILLECVLSYVEPSAAEALLCTLTMRLANATLVIYDPVLPFHKVHGAGLASMMHQKFEERGAPLLSCVQSVEQYELNLRKAGWKHVTALSVNQAAHLFLSAAERKAGVLAEPFDEFASLAFLQNYYAIGVASTNKGVFQRLHEMLFAGKSTLYEREQAVLDRIALAEARLASIESYTLQQSITVQRSQPTTACKLGVTIRPARVTDTHTLVQVYQSAFESAAQKYTSVKKYVKFSLKALKEFEKTYPSLQRSVLFVAEANDGAVVGCIGVKVKQTSSQTVAGLAELSHFCVAQEHQRGGVGQSLLTQAVVYCQEVLGSQATVSLTVLRDLEAARRLYGTKGFEHISTEKLGNDCELYHLRLIL